MMGNAGYGGMMGGYGELTQVAVRRHDEWIHQWKHWLHGKHDARRVWQHYFLVRPFHVHAFRAGVFSEVRIDS